MSKQPAKRRRVKGPTMLTNWLGNLTLAEKVDDPEKVYQDESAKNKAPQEKSLPTKDSKKRKTGFDKAWLKKFPWLQCVNENFGLLCELCIKFKRTPKNGSLIWTSKPCVIVNMESINKHAKSEAHKEAEQLDAQRILSENGEGLVQAVAVQSSMEKTALIGAFRSLYWLPSEEIPHSTKYSSLLWYAKRMGCSYLNYLQKGENVNYESQRTLQEMLESIAKTIYQPYLENVLQNLHDRFPDNPILEAMTILDPDLINADDPTFNEWIQHMKLKTLMEQFKSVGTEQQVMEEWETLRTLLMKECKEMSFRQTLKKVANLDSLFPCLSKLASIGLVLPVSTADCERCFSCLNRVKTPLRNRLSEKVLNYLLTISVEGPKEEDFDFDKCVCQFGKIKQRKICTK